MKNAPKPQAGKAGVVLNVMMCVVIQVNTAGNGYALQKTVLRYSEQGGVRIVQAVIVKSKK